MHALENKINLAFQKTVRPEQLLVEECEENYDIQNELKRRVGSRDWPEVTVSDWLSSGEPVISLKTYLLPEAFAYYLPSMMVGSLFDREFTNFVLEALLPSNAKRVPKGTWWNRFVAALTHEQRSVIVTYLQEMYKDTEHSLLAGDALDLWNGLANSQ